MQGNFPWECFILLSQKWLTLHLLQVLIWYNVSFLGLKYNRSSSHFHRNTCTSTSQTSGPQRPGFPHLPHVLCLFPLLHPGLCHEMLTSRPIVSLREMTVPYNNMIIPPLTTMTPFLGDLPFFPHVSLAICFSCYQKTKRTRTPCNAPTHFLI